MQIPISYNYSAVHIETGTFRTQPYYNTCSKNARSSLFVHSTVRNMNNGVVATKLTL